MTDCCQFVTPCCPSGTYWIQFGAACWQFAAACYQGPVPCFQLRHDGWRCVATGDAAPMMAHRDALHLTPFIPWSVCRAASEQALLLPSDMARIPVNPPLTHQSARSRCCHRRLEVPSSLPQFDHPLARRLALTPNLQYGYWHYNSRRLRTR